MGFNEKPGLSGCHAELKKSMRFSFSPLGTKEFLHDEPFSSIAGMGLSITHPIP
tara:strand:+ start:378 stop:539 length:162 start_codon:yes stop_codon:yes gene_type:complete